MIRYDRKQPEFYEDTITYITKRSSKKRLDDGINFYLKNYVWPPGLPAPASPRFSLRGCWKYVNGMLEIREWGFGNT